MAACLHGDMPYSGKAVKSGAATPYTTSVDVNVLDRCRSLQSGSACHGITRDPVLLLASDDEA